MMMLGRLEYITRIVSCWYWVWGCSIPGILCFQ